MPSSIVSIKCVVISVWVLLIGPVFVVTGGCAPTPPHERGEQARGEAVTGENESEDKLALVNGESVTRGEFDHRLESLPEYARVRYRSQERKRAYLDAVVQFEALADEAERRDLGSTPGARQAVKRVLAERAIERALRDRISMSDVTERAIEQFYRKHRERFVTPERRRVALIATDRRAWAEKLKSRVDAVDSEGRINRFRQLAARYSVAPEPFSLRAEGGAAGWVKPPSEETERTELAEVVFGLDQGQVSEPFRDRGSWTLAMWIEREPAVTSTPEEAADTIRRTLFERRRQELKEGIVSTWRDDADVEIRDTILEGLAAPNETRYTRRDQLPLKTVDAEGADE